MLSKCLWKMLTCDESVRGSSKPVEVDDVLDSLLDAIETLPQRKDSRSDPVFEPHFRLVSVLHKLVRQEKIKVSISLSTFPSRALANRFCSRLRLVRFSQRLHGLENSRLPKILVIGSRTF